jgi:hypothetical protein
LTEEQAGGLHSFDGCYLSVGLEELRACMAGVKDERAAKAVELSQLVIEISDALVDLGVFPIWDIFRLSTSA